MHDSIKEALIKEIVDIYGRLDCSHKTLKLQESLHQLLIVLKKIGIEQ